MSQNILFVLSPLKALPCVAMLLLLQACGGDNYNEQTPTLIVQPQRFTVQLQGKGELASVQSRNISVPQGGPMGPKVLLWIAADGTPVKEGDVIARFDGEKSISERDKALLDVENVGLSESAKRRELDGTQRVTNNALKNVAAELDMTDRYANADPDLFSRNELIDALQNRDYLGAQRIYNRWKKGSSQQLSAAEVALLDAQRARHAGRAEQHSQALQQLEVRAPADGVLVLKRDWDGEKPASGSSYWPGEPFAELPDLSTLEAHLKIAEAEAAGLVADLPASVSIDADPQRQFAGTVKTVDKLAKKRDKDNPQKFFGFTVALQESDLHLMRPGNQVNAKVTVSDLENVLVVPNQALFHDDENTWVYIQNGSEFAQRNVRIGQRSPNRSVVTEGLAAGDVIALIKPEPL